MDKICGIYKITSPNGKSYIGKSFNILLRFHSYRKLYCKNQILLYRSLKKYGTENHKFEIIEYCPKNNLSEREIYYIDFYDTFHSRNGLNLTRGGDGGRLSFDEIFQLKMHGYNVRFRVKYRRRKLKKEKKISLPELKKLKNKENALNYLKNLRIEQKIKSE